MNLKDVKTYGEPKRRKKRLGCGPGSGLGKTCGRGSKGAGARSGTETGLYFEGGQMPMVRRIPKRGFTNIFKKTFSIINLSQINSLEGKDVIDVKTLLESGLIKKEYGDGVKVLGDGDLKRPVKVFAHKFSKSAVEKIKAAGGEAKVIE
ncbi:MAG: 50S ribosomal protein L15 [Candidatus Brocadiales bacterium]|nr:50S ribosomal protein L15 [Candidatus Bathyanammoxibius amoris]